MNYPDPEVCFICDNDLKERKTRGVKEKGVQKLQELNLRRKNEKHQNFLKENNEVKLKIK